MRSMRGGRRFRSSDVPGDEAPPEPLRRQLGQFRAMLAFLGPYRAWFAVAFVGVVVAAGLGLVFPRIMGSLVDEALGETATTPTLDRIALALVAVFAAQAAFNYLRIYGMAVVGEGVVADLRKAVYARVIRLPVPFFDARRTGEITSRLTSDAAVVQSSVSTALAQALSQAITLIGGVILMFVISWQLSLTVLLFLPIVVIGAAVFGRWLNRISTTFQDRVAEANALADESIAAIRVVKWFTAETETINRYDEAIRSSYAVALRRARIRALFIPFITFIGFSTLALVLWVGGRLVLDDVLTAGDLVSFLLYTLVVAGAIGAFTGLYSQLQEALGASRRIFELLGETSEVDAVADPVHIADRPGSVTMRDVSFAYPGREAVVLRGIDLEVAPGQMVALVGPSGSGKSTLTQLVARFYDVSSGAVLVDGADVKTQDLDELRAQMAAVPQEVQLFSGTIAENLRVALPAATDEQLIAAARAANAHDFVVQFPDGYDTVVGERGVQLSGGQRQRVAIARAVLADPAILILDEATSSLDAEAEALVQDALDKLMEGRTTIVIAHRLSTVRAADRLIVVVDGEIVEEGSHDELVARGGVYASLSRRQLVS